jgi:hypothetical protein
MKHNNPITGFVAGLGVLLALASSVASADVTTEQKVSIDGVGFMAIVNMSGTSKTAISGNRSRQDSDLQMQSKLARFVARNAAGPTAEIVVLDADKMYHLNINKKEYTETSFTEMRARMQKALQEGKAEGAERQQPAAIDQSKCEWLEPKSDVKRTGQKTTVAGFEAEQVIITAEQPCKDKETGAICEIALTLDDWMAPSFTTSDEVLKYQKAYAQKLGLDTALTQDMSERAKAMFGQYKGVWANVIDKMKGIKGYPVRSSFSLGIGGDQCKQAQAARQQAGSDSPASSSGTPGSSGSAASSSAPSTTSPADLANKMGAKLGSLFHKKKEEPQTASSDQGAQPPTAAAVPPPATGPSGTITLMTISTELLSVSNAPIPADKFQVPAGFKKVEPKEAT